MLIIGTDYHPSFQQIAFFSEESGKCGERRIFAAAPLQSRICEKNPVRPIES